MDYLPWITGSGGALVVLAIGLGLFISGKIHSDSEFQRVVAESEARSRALETAQTINTELTRAGGVTNKLIGALVDVATDRNADRADHHHAVSRDPDLTAQDLGLRP